MSQGSAPSPPDIYIYISLPAPLQPYLCHPPIPCSITPPIYYLHLRHITMADFESPVGIALYHTDPPTFDYFHWALVVGFTPSLFTGYVRMYQILRPEPTPGQQQTGPLWIASHKTVNLMGTNRFVGIVYIGRLPFGLSDLHTWISEVPAEKFDYPPPPYFWTCAWYIISIIDGLRELLTDEGDLPTDLVALYNRVRERGTVLAAMVRHNAQPNVVRIS
ncbi:hypothetical protein PLICRDRAFT_340239 [Plicaturopsis crispa FD-325 SS-3]|uniref:Unplaced genomic scaffold PLICRscaffold_16, whole genome shotgun sequence n=1 Tax=Plicaturopsis crispa FD-325 SS-3 TaxID=944288 RepID=A0A0C9T946_PLICR|nr:hypothetical protein PLICRDRAFT_340239 [Plicaturopsis crispa FD-325 SS-3]